MLVSFGGFDYTEDGLVEVDLTDAAGPVSKSILDSVRSVLDEQSDARRQLEEQVAIFN